MSGSDDYSTSAAYGTCSFSRRNLPSANSTGKQVADDSGENTRDTQAPKLGPIYNLPNEILHQILGYLGGPPPSVDLHDEPRLNITESSNANLKATSCVSKRWRQIVLPILFKHTRFVLPSSKLPVIELPKHERPMLAKQIAPFLDFVTQNSIDQVVLSFTLVVNNATNFSRHSHSKNYCDLFHDFWMLLFSKLDPPELLIVAPSKALAALTASHIVLAEAWQFDCPCHYLQLKRTLTPIRSNEHPCDLSENFYQARNERMKDGFGNSVPTSARRLEYGDDEEIPRAEFSTVFQIRPWTSLLLNEGSFIRAYATYEWWMRQPPSILPDLMGASDEIQQTPLISSTIRDMSYIAMFPLVSHFKNLVEHFPRVDRLYTQLVPRNEILQDRTKMRQVEATDLWNERNGCYASLMRELFSPPISENYKLLKVFESGDAADRDAWNMAVEWVKQSATGWQVTGDGVFERRSAQAPSSSSDDGDNEPSLLSVSASEQTEYD